MVSKNFVKIDYFSLLSLILLCLLAFLNLGNQYLWQDEAENAVIAQNILKFGYPCAFDGSLLVVSDVGYRENYTWIFQPWLQNYVTAISFYLFGKSTFSARFPFVLFGIFSFIAAYFLAKRLFSLRTARISSVILLMCVPYLLMIRQARYYSLALFFALMLIHGYLDYAEKKRFSEFKIIISSFFLFNSNFGLFFPLMLGLITHYLIFNFERQNIKRDLILIFLIGIMIVPIFIYFKGWLHRVPLSRSFVLGNIKFYLRSINRYIVPIRFIAIIYLIFAVFKKRFILFRINKHDNKNLSLIFSIFITTILFMGIAKFRSLRYVIYLIPLLVILESYILARWIQRNKILPVICMVLLITTDLFHHSLSDFFMKPLSKSVMVVDKKFPFVRNKNKLIDKIIKEAEKEANEKFVVRSCIKDYLYEITHDYDGPIEYIVTYLKKNAKKDDTVKIPYGDCAVAFYTDLKVDNKMEPGKSPYPEWIIPRDYWTAPDFYNSNYYKEIQKKYTKITLDCPDLRWENRPDDLGYHNFRTVRDYPKKVVIYRKK